MKIKRKNDLWIYGRNFLKPLTEISKSELGKAPVTILDSNVSGRHSTYSKALNSLPGDKITVFAEIEDSINNEKELQHSRFETLTTDKNLNEIKSTLLDWHKNAFTTELINHYVSYINSVPKMKGRSNLQRVDCLIEHHKHYDSKNEISFFLLLCLIHINLNCDDGGYFKSIIHYPQENYSFDVVRNFLYDFFIIDNVNRLIDDGYNIFLCTNDSGIAQFANYLSKLTLIITIHELHQQPSKDKLYGIEKEIYKKIMNDKESHEIITKIRTAIYTRWEGSPKRAYVYQYTPITQAIQLALYGDGANIYPTLYNQF